MNKRTRELNFSWPSDHFNSFRTSKALYHRTIVWSFAHFVIVSDNISVLRASSESNGISEKFGYLGFLVVTISTNLFSSSSHIPLSLFYVTHFTLKFEYYRDFSQKFDTVEIFKKCIKCDVWNSQT